VNNFISELDSHSAPESFRFLIVNRNPNLLLDFYPPQPNGGAHPLPNMFVSMLQRMAMETDKFASSTGTMGGLELA